MRCIKCGGETNPINIEGSIHECPKCRYRQHIHFPGVLNVNDIPIQASADMIAELPRQVQDIFDN